LQGVDPIVDVTSCADAVVVQATEDSYAYDVEGLIILERAGSCRASATTRLWPAVQDRAGLYAAVDCHDAPASRRTYGAGDVLAGS